MLLSALVVVSCSSTYRSMSVEEKRAYLVDLEKKTLAELVAEHTEAKADLDAAAGYAIFSNIATKVPLVGAGEGLGVVVNSRTGARTYLRVGRFDVGGGLGARRYRVAIIFFDEEALEKLASGKIEFGAGVEVSAGTDEVGTKSGGRTGSRTKDRVLYQLSEAGSSATWTVRAIRYTVLDLGDSNPEPR